VHLTLTVTPAITEVLLVLCSNQQHRESCVFIFFTSDPLPFSFHFFLTFSYRWVDLWAGVFRLFVPKKRGGVCIKETSGRTPLSCLGQRLFPSSF